MPEPTLYTYRNCQAEANWTGIEYAMASFYILAAQRERSAEIVNNVDKRYRRLGQIWNHAECGDHYYRALSSWALLPALTGWSYDAVRKALTLTKNSEGKWCAPWVSCEGFGRLETDEKGYTIRCLSGSLSLNQVIVVGEGLQQARLSLNGGKTDVAVSAHDGKWQISFAQITLTENDKLELRFG
jgi:hypothetical protein